MAVTADALCDFIMQVMMMMSSLPERLDNYSIVKDDLDTLNQLILLIGEMAFKMKQRQNPQVRPLLGHINKELKDICDWMEHLPYDQGGKLGKRKYLLIFKPKTTDNHISIFRTNIAMIVQSLKGIAGSAPPAAVLTNSSDESGKLKNDGEASASKHELTPSQKICLGYCSLLPENHIFQVGDLINLWMAEGFLVPSSDERPEDIGHSFISQFLNMSIFERVEVDECGSLKTCKMDPQGLGLAKSMRFSDSITVMDPEENRSYKGIHRVSFHYSLDLSCGIPNSVFDDAKYLQTILLAPKITQLRMPDTMKMKSPTCEAIFSTFKTMRLLDLHNLGIKTVPLTINGLKDLRYLNLSENEMIRLPSSITKLCKLQTLILSGCRNLKELPKDLSALINLRHLDIGGCQSLTGVPAGLGRLTSLVTLSHYVVGKSSSIQELTGLNELSGNLEILHLERVKDTKVRRWLTQKKHLDGLALRWDHTDDNIRIQLHTNDMNSLRLLQPHANLKVLTVMGYKGENFPDWLLSLRCLVKFELDNCPTCKSLPPLYRLSSLKILRLQSLDSLESIKTSVGNKDLAIKKKDDGEALFSAISKLEIRSCPKLTTMPKYPRLDRKLVLVGSSLKPLLKTMENGNVTTIASQPPLSELKSMLIENIEENFPQELKVFENFTSLEELQIRECHHFGSLPKGFEHLASLKSLTIENCRELHLSSFHGWEGLRNLRSLELRDIPKLTSLPTGLQDLISLQCLTIHYCKGLKSVPGIIGKLISLKQLEISACDKLASLPKELSELSLDLLRIPDSPLLESWFHKVKDRRSSVISGIKEVITTQGSFPRCWTSQI